MPSSQNKFAAAAASAVGAALDMDPGLFPVGAPPKPEMGDFAVGCFPAARVARKAPPAIAAEVATAFEPNELLLSATAAGPFVNFRARPAALYAHLFGKALGQGGAAGLIDISVGAGESICIDYSSPNISKHLAYHHIRSTVIGHALANIYRAAGYHVVGINHLGDWGTTHGMLIAAFKKWGAPDPITVDALNELYVRFRAEMKEDAALEQEGRAWFKKLEDGDAEARALWSNFRAVSLAEFQQVYDTLGVTFDEVKGESEYEDQMQPVIDMLEQKGLTSISQGALVVALEEHDLPPLLLRKQDGATLYATRDLAAALYRWNSYHFARSLYVVDRGQGMHFKQLFLTLGKAGCDWAERCAHVSFGLVRVGGKKTGTSKGNVVLLKEVLADAAKRAMVRTRESNPDMDETTLAETARTVGVGAVVFANLASQRERDVDFEWEQVLSTDGDSGPYIQYAHARCARMLSRAGDLEPDVAANSALLSNPGEWAVARKLVDFGDAVVRAADSNEPHLVSRYLLELCATFNRWYNAGNTDSSLRVLVDDEAVSRARLTLVATTQSVLATGLALLGLDAPDAM